MRVCTTILTVLFSAETDKPEKLVRDEDNQPGGSKMWQSEESLLPMQIYDKNWLEISSERFKDSIKSIKRYSSVDDFTLRQRATIKSKGVLHRIKSCNSASYKNQK